MDNLTHSLVGALLGQMGLKRKTGLAMPTLIIAANIPDIDVVAVLLGGNQHLALRRGLTHGPIAWVLLPLLLWGAMLWYDSWQTRRGKRPEKRLPVHKGWLLALAYIGTLSHPALDWLNNYGVRLLEPFSHQWFYGDSIFIVDIWMLIVLGLGVWFSLRLERAERSDWRRPAKAAFLVLCAYIFANGLIAKHAETITRLAVSKAVYVDGDLVSIAGGLIMPYVESSAQTPDTAIIPELVVANAIPLAFWKREVLWRDKNYAGSGSFNLFTAVNGVKIDRVVAHGMNDKLVTQAILNNSQVKAFLFWSRMPLAKLNWSAKEVTFTDQRFAASPARGSFTVTARLRGKEMQ